MPAVVPLLTAVPRIFRFHIPHRPLILTRRPCGSRRTSIPLVSDLSRFGRRHFRFHSLPTLRWGLVRPIALGPPPSLASTWLLPTYQAPIPSVGVHVLHLSPPPFTLAFHCVFLPAPFFWSWSSLVHLCGSGPWTCSDQVHFTPLPVLLFFPAYPPPPQGDPVPRTSTVGPGTAQLVEA